MDDDVIVVGRERWRMISLYHLLRFRSRWSDRRSDDVDNYGICRLLSVNRCKPHEVRRVAAPLHW